MRMGDVRGPMVVGAGRAGLELFGVVPRLPDHDVPVEMEEISVQVGGQAAIAMATAAALGCRARLATKLADDFLGAFILDAFKEAGVEARGARPEEARLSRLGVHLASRSFDKRLHVFTGGDVPPLDEKDVVPESLLEGADALLLDGHAPAAQRLLAERAREAGIPVIFDGTEMGPDIRGLVGLCDVLITSERLASELATAGSTRDLLRALQELGPRAVVMTLGEQGAAGIHGDEYCEIRGPNVAVVDTTGAGGVFQGAFAAALLSDLPFEHCLRFATVAASLSCKRLGGWAGIPSREEVVKAVADNR